MKRLLTLILVLALSAVASAQCPKSTPNVPVNVTTATDTTIVTGQPGKKIYIWEFVLENNHASTDVIVTLKDGSTAMNGGGQLIKAGGGAWTRYCNGMTLDVTVGNTLTLTTSAAGTTSGYIKYTVE